MRIIASAAIAVLLAPQAGAQAPGWPVPRGKDSSAIATILKRHFDAVGLTAKPVDMRYMHLKEQTEMGPGGPPVEMELFMIRPAPGKSNMRARSIMNMPMLGPMETVVNGDIAWVISSSGPPMLLSEEQARQVAEHGNPDPIASMPQATVTLARRATIDGREMDGVRFTDTLGSDAVLYFDRKTGLASAVKGGSRAVPSDTSFVLLMGEYKSFGGPRMPTLMSMRQGGGQSMSIRITQIEFMPIDTMMFVPPPAVLELLKTKKP